MKKIIKQKGFIQIPLLLLIIGIITSVSVGTGVVLYQQDKAEKLTANISQTLETQQEKETQEVQTITQEELLRQSQLETEKAKAEAEQLRKVLEEKEQQESQSLVQRKAQRQTQLNESSECRTSIITSLELVLKKNQITSEFQAEMLKAGNNWINGINSLISKNESYKLTHNTEFTNNLVDFFNDYYQRSIKIMNVFGEFFAEKTLVNNLNKSVNSILTNFKYSTSTQILTKSECLEWIAVVEQVNKNAEQHWNYNVKMADKSFAFLDLFEKQVEDYFSEIERELSAQIPSQPSYTTNNYFYDNSISAGQQWLQNVYKQRELEAMQGINYSLQGILNEIRY